MIVSLKIALLALVFSTAGYAATVKVDMGGMVLSLSDSPTAQVFHIVDQLSQWDVYTHGQYARWAKETHLLDEVDNELLRQHAEMRKKRGWGQGFEQTFLVDDSI